MKRLAEAELLTWMHAKRRKPLIIRGARQVGKTWLIENFLAKQFASYVKIDLEQQPYFHTAFAEDLSPQHMLKVIEVQAGRIIPGKTLLFIDEIQECPRAITALRYFYEELPELHVVAAGSMLEFALGEISVPVGRVQYLHLHPMTFYEFLLAQKKEIMAETLLQHPKQQSNFVVQAIHKELKQYFFVGGMPEAVSTYAETNSFVEVHKVHAEIVASYQDDFTKYRPSADDTILNAVLKTSAQSVGKQIIYTKLYEHASSATNRKALNLLCKAKLMYTIHTANPAGFPLGLEGKRFKIAMVDIGLMQHLCGVEPFIMESSGNLLSIYQGQLAEQFVAQELIASQSAGISTQTQLYYWSRSAPNAQAEVDFLMAKDGRIYPIEVKSGPSGKLRSLHLFLKTYSHCTEGWVLQDAPYQELPEQKLIFWPLYATAQLSEM